MRVAVHLLPFALAFLCVVAAGASAEETTGPNRAEQTVSSFVDRYFSTWSRRDMEGYAATFHPQAFIHFVDRDGVPRGSSLSPFIEGQRRAHAAAKTPMREFPLTKQIEIDGNIAHVLVRWKLVRGPVEDLGTDYFTLLRTADGWKIISLVFRGDE